ncbi:hypothetical protein QW131_04840 [Roseibium salinum]|nr:hypothetical protein [Roseibium salinum]
MFSFTSEKELSQRTRRVKGDRDHGRHGARSEHEDQEERDDEFGKGAHDVHHAPDHRDERPPQLSTFRVEAIARTTATAPPRSVATIAMLSVSSIAGT